MAHEVLERIEEAASYFEAHAEEAESLGCLPDNTAKQMRATGIIRMLQPTRYGGEEAHPCDFIEAVIELGRRCSSSGWVAGVVGVHPWELALLGETVQQEVWAEDPDAWIASPYAPIGRARPVDGGFILRGRWPFSSGTDHCQWIFLGGVVVGADGEPTPDSHSRHFLLPRADYHIVEDSWQVAGLKGTGSKDVVVDDAFVPTARTVIESELLSGELGLACEHSGPLYRMPFMGIFPVGVTAAVIGIAEGALAAALAYQRTRITGLDTKAVEDPHVMSAIGEAASEVRASRLALLDGTRRIYDCLDRNQAIPLIVRAEGRRDQVRAAWRAVAAVDTLFASCGGNALRLTKPIQRFWRDAHAGLQHVIHIPGPVYESYTSLAMGVAERNSTGFSML